MDLGLKGKVAIVTGATRGLGRAMAEALAAEGMAVVICARDAEQVNSAAASLAQLSYANGGAGALGHVADATDPSAMERLVNETVKHLGGVDVLVNNAGEARRGTLAELPDATWREQFDLNLF